MRFQQVLSIKEVRLQVSVQLVDVEWVQCSVLVVWCAGNTTQREWIWRTRAGGSILFDGAPLITSRVEKIQHGNGIAIPQGVYSTSINSSV